MLRKTLLLLVAVTLLAAAGTAVVWRFRGLESEEPVGDLEELQVTVMHGEQEYGPFAARGSSSTSTSTTGPSSRFRVDTGCTATVAEAGGRAQNQTRTPASTARFATSSPCERASSAVRPNFCAQPTPR